ncbi:pyocin S6 family toxin immunity protein [Pseudomonas sp. 7P_10.2_Bac1]|uniref:pyocin S6 family toxin immunity protein n=1 Tax=Pseudomonas sp. 7P_10.2_Bac1 TaxID=2971614 RepID=UPI0021C5DAF6|nr:pyocin S6 family toxin immunity protein [Pseudomonas sp. 7P_10.2_Bac1]MCU1726607.1 pyocin S6 family toxin immunity protein [Pseudomonas sp. 7P_10.2_Bac1]
MKLRLTGFLPVPTDDDRVKFKFFINESLESSALTLMGWTHLDDALGGEQELTPVQAAAFAGLLEEPQIIDLTLFIGCVS